MVLMSDITFTSKGLYWCKMTHLIGMAGNKEVLGHQGPLCISTRPAAMWRLDLRQLLQQPTHAWT
jgi:hypothetical protein